MQCLVAINTKHIYIDNSKPKIFPHIHYFIYTAWMSRLVQSQVYRQTVFNVRYLYRLFFSLSRSNPWLHSPRFNQLLEKIKINENQDAAFQFVVSFFPLMKPALTRMNEANNGGVPDRQSSELSQFDGLKTVWKKKKWTDKITVSYA